MITEYDDAGFEPPHTSSPTDHLLSELQLYDYRPFEDERLANCWVEGEWHELPDAEMYETLLDGFRMFHDHDRNRNSVDFHYWIGSSGMGELVMEQNYRRISLRKWQREA